MTKITKYGITLNEALYKELGSPPCMFYVFRGYDVYLIPSPSRIQVIQRNKKPFMRFAGSERQFFHFGEFKEAIEDVHGLLVYCIKEANR